MVKLKEGRLFRTLCISLEILPYLLGKVYINRMTPVRTIPCVNKPVLLVGRYKSLRCARAGKKKRGLPSATEKRSQVQREAEGVCMRKLCVCVRERQSVCVCITGLYESLHICAVHMCNMTGWFLKRHHKWTLLRL